MNSRRVILKHLAFGFGAGMIISIVPIELAILLGPGLLVVWVLAVRRRPPGFGLASYIIAVVVVLLAICTLATAGAAQVSSSDPTPALPDWM
jgi:hypothetical protein